MVGLVALRFGLVGLVGASYLASFAALLLTTSLLGCLLFSVGIVAYFFAGDDGHDKTWSTTHVLVPFKQLSFQSLLLSLFSSPATLTTNVCATAAVPVERMYGAT